MKVFAGAKPIVGLGKHQFNLLGFALRNPGWHAYGHDRITKRVIASLQRRKVIEVTGDQFRFNQVQS